MANLTVQLNSLIKSLVHRPSVTDTIDGTTYEFPLYKKASAKAQYEDKEMETRASKSEKFKRAVAGHYTSPTNIRRIFITHKGVRVDLFSAPIGSTNSANDMSSYRKYELKKYDNKTLAELFNDMLNYNNNYQNYMSEKVINKDAIEPKHVKFTGKPLNIINGAYTLNNIEELYIDWTLFLSEETMQYVAQRLGVGANIMSVCAQMANETINGTPAKNIITDNNTMRVLLGDFLGQIDIAKRFPRLRTVAFIENLDAIISNNSYGVKNDLAIFGKNQKNNRPTWFEINKSIIGSIGGVTFRSVIRTTTDEFRVKADTYAFDNERLDALVKAYQIKAREIRIQERMQKAESETDVIDNSTSEAEKKILDIIKSHNNDSNYARLAVIAATAGMPNKQKSQILDGFSTPNRKRMAGWFGLSSKKTT